MLGEFAYGCARSISALSETIRSIERVELCSLAKDDQTQGV